MARYMILHNKTTRRILATALLCLGYGSYSHAQSAYEATLGKIDAQHQDCLDNSEDMNACSDRYFKSIDSMLNVVYRAALNDSPAAEKTTLRNEQRDWLTGRNTKFREIEAEARKKDGQGSMEQNMIIEDKAAYIRERVDELIGKAK